MVIIIILVNKKLQCLNQDKLSMLVAGTAMKVLSLSLCVCYIHSVGPVLDKQLEDWLGKADLIHTPARAIIAPYPLL